ncbi:MAG: nucleoside-diphosphate kinase [Patescibacteria group bacterium]|nr:nucleoside-diphosphate kinase [Patescibacteria group bacterium]
MVERTLAIIKPDGVMMKVAQQIKGRYTDAGLTIVRARSQIMQWPQAAELYRDHARKFFFTGAVLAMISGPSIALLLEGENAVSVVRKLNGATVPSEAEPGTIRYDFRSAGGPFNTVHASDSPEAAAREIQLIFGDTPPDSS